MTHPLSEAGTSVRLSAYEAQVLIGASISGCNMSPDRVFDLQAAWSRLRALGLIDRTDGLAIATPEGVALIASMLAALNAALIQPTPAETEGMTGHCAKCGRDWDADNVPRCDECHPPIGDGEGDLVARLRSAAVTLGAPGDHEAILEAATAIEALNRQVNQYAWERDKAREERDAAESRSEAFWKPQVSTLSRQLEEAREALKPFADLGEVVLAEAPPDAVAAWSFTSSSEEAHSISLDAFRRAKETVSHG